MFRWNYHTHNNLCDGEGSIAEYTDAALGMGLEALGFSSHAPIPVANDWTLKKEDLPLYFSRIEDEKERVGENLQIYRGLEIDYIPGHQEPGGKEWDELGLDYRIGSVHSTESLRKNPEYCCIDGPRENLKWLVDNVHGGSFQSLCESYYQRVCAMVKAGGFDIVAHFDLVKKYNGGGEYFREDASWYRETVSEALRVLSGSGIMLEVNTGGISRGILKQPYPSAWILSNAAELDIPVCLGADAHSPQNLVFYFEQAAALLSEAGYRQVQILLDGKWQSRELDSSQPLSP